MTNRALKALFQFCDDRGQGLAEYGLILVFIVAVVAITLKTSPTVQLVGMFNDAVRAFGP